MKKRNNPQYRINLVKVFNRAYSGSPRELRDGLRGALSSQQFRSQFSKRVIDQIVIRTNEGVDKHNKKFPAYSKSYIQSDTFKIYGKSPSEINLELSGEMLSSLRGVYRMQEIVIELIGQNNKDKAHGHINGIRRARGGKVVRDFLGLPDEILDDIMLETVEQFRSEQFEEASLLFAGQDAVQQFGQVGNQDEFVNRMSVQDVLAMIARNLNG